MSKIKLRMNTPSETRWLGRVMDQLKYPYERQGDYYIMDKETYQHMESLINTHTKMMQKRYAAAQAAYERAKKSRAEK